MMRSLPGIIWIQTFGRNYEQEEKTLQISALQFGIFDVH